MQQMVIAIGVVGVAGQPVVGLIRRGLRGHAGDCRSAREAIAYRIVAVANYAVDAMRVIGNCLVVVDLATAIAFFTALGMTIESEAPIEGR